MSAWLRQYMVMQEDKGGPLLQALMASLPAVPQMPKKPSARLPGESSAASSPVWQGQVCSCKMSGKPCARVQASRSWFVDTFVMAETLIQCAEHSQRPEEKSAGKARRVSRKTSCMQAPSPAAQPPMEFEAALTRLAGGMPCLSADAYLQEKESKVNFMRKSPSCIYIPYECEELPPSRQPKCADDDGACMQVAHATELPEPALQPAGQVPFLQSTPPQEVKSIPPCVVPLQNSCHKALEILILGQCGPIDESKICCWLLQVSEGVMPAQSPDTAPAPATAAASAQQAPPLGPSSVGRCIFLAPPAVNQQD